LAKVKENQLDFKKDSCLLLATRAVGNHCLNMATCDLFSLKKSMVTFAKKTLVLPKCVCVCVCVCVFFCGGLSSTKNLPQKNKEH
jgi:hypothetical protein